MFEMGRIPFIEGYNPIYPDVDTKFADKYDEELFQQIEIGEDTLSIIQKIGRPIGIREHENGEWHWNYSTDGKCDWADFAWLIKALVINQDGIVVKKFDGIAYD
jgi:hypothetical protein